MEFLSLISDLPNAVSLLWISFGGYHCVRVFILHPNRRFRTSEHFSAIVDADRGPADGQFRVHENPGLACHNKRQNPHDCGPDQGRMLAGEMDKRNMYYWTGTDAVMKYESSTLRLRSFQLVGPPLAILIILLSRIPMITVIALVSEISWSACDVLTVAMLSSTYLVAFLKLGPVREVIEKQRNALLHIAACLVEAACILLAALLLDVSRNPRQKV